MVLLLSGVRVRGVPVVVLRVVSSINNLMVNRPWTIGLRRGALVIVIITLTVVGLWMTVHQRQQREVNKLSTASAKALELFNQEQFDESARAFANISETATQPAQASQARLWLAGAMFFRNHEDDRRHALMMLQRMVADTAMTSYQRAMAVELLLRFWMLTQDEPLARQVIFSGQPLSVFLDDTGLDMALRRTYEWADQLAPLPAIALRLANWYGAKLEETPAITPQQHTEWLEHLKQWTHEAQRRLEDPTTSAWYAVQERGYLYGLLGLCRASLAKSSGGNVASAEQAFERSLQLLASQETAMAHETGLMVRVWYAGTLADAYGEQRLGDIVNILKPITESAAPVEGRTAWLHELLNHVQHPTLTEPFIGNTHLKQRLVQLAAMVPTFHDALIHMEVGH